MNSEQSKLTKLFNRFDSLSNARESFLPLFREEFTKNFNHNFCGGNAIPDDELMCILRSARFSSTHIGLFLDTTKNETGTDILFPYLHRLYKFQFVATQINRRILIEMKRLKLKCDKAYDSCVCGANGTYDSPKTMSEYDEISHLNKECCWLNGHVTNIFPLLLAGKSSNNFRYRMMVYKKI